MKKFINIISILILSSLCAHAATVRHSCALDSLKGEELMTIAENTVGSHGDKIIAVANQLIGSPKGFDCENDSIGTSKLNFQNFTKSSFINSVLAVVKATEAPHPGFHALEESWISLTRRRGEDNGFPSKLIYGADWIVDNIYRGNIKEMTELVSDGSFKTKSLDYVTRNRDKFPALKDSLAYDMMRMVEMGYKSHKIPHLKKQTLGKKDISGRLENGDIIMLLSPQIDFDVYDIGFIELRDGEPYFIHVTDQGVVKEPDPLQRFFKLNNQFFYGYRILRPQ